MSDLSQRLQAAIGHMLQDDPETGEVFNAGASEADFAQLEQLIQAKLPDDFKALYRVFNGQTDEAGYVFDGEEWLSLERMAEEWEVWKDLLDDGTFEDDDDEAENEDIDPEIKPVWWSPLWIPFHLPMMARVTICVWIWTPLLKVRMAKSSACGTTMPSAAWKPRLLPIG